MMFVLLSIGFLAGVITAFSPNVVLGGRGRVRALADGRPAGLLEVRSNRLYTPVERPWPRDWLLKLRFSPGVEAYSFTFGEAYRGRLCAWQRY